MRVDWSVLAFTLAASILTGLLFGIAPALRLAHTRVNEMLNDGGGKGTAYGGRQRGRSLLLLGEVALAVVLLAAAGLLIRSFAHLASVRPGFQPANLLTMKLSLPDTKYGEVARRAAFTRNVLRRVSGIPGVRAASSISVLPMRSYFLSLPANVAAYHIDGEPELPAAERPSADFRVVSRDFLAAMGISLLRGRDFNGHDDLDSKRVALVNEALVRRAGKDVLGRKIQIMSGAPREIVGVIPDVRLYNLDGGVRPGVFVLNDQSPSFVVTLLVRTGSDPAAAAGAVRRAVQAEDGQQPVSDIQTMEQVVADSLLLRRLSMSMLASFASLALLLAGVGIYGLTAYSVSRRTREIGLRMALGAGRGDILSLVVGRGLLVGIAGVALGVPAALGVARLMRGMLYGITPADPLVFATVPAILLLIAALACYVPARRAMRVDPVVALKYE
jgi:putative ABC transport system permease protein